VEDNWLVMKGRRSERRGQRQFFDICDRVARHQGFTPGISWGDARIRDAADASFDEDALTSPGNAMIWRAIGTNHHIAWVVNRLARGFEP
jgi:hypothetical protein